MKNRIAILLSGCFAILFSCQSTQKSAGDFNLLPVPQQMEITGASGISVDEVLFYYSTDGSELPVQGGYLSEIKPAAAPSRAQVVFRIDHTMDMKPEGYTLEISANQISITGKDLAGLLYGFMTLHQLMEDASEQDVPLPVCSIKDYPLLSYRAIHLDMKHHREKTGYYYQLVDQLARYKVNAIIAEVEDKLGYERQPVVGSADAMSISEWRKLSDYALERNIEISPLVQGLGHASFILKHNEYMDIRDDPGSDWAFNPLDPKTYEVQFDLYLDALEAMPHGRYLHVGGDEVHTTGRGSGKTELELQLTWLNKVCGFAGEHGRIPIFWDDMPIKYAGLYGPMFNTRLTRAEVDSLWAENEQKLLEYLDLFPKNCIYMRWNYSTPRAEGNIKAMEWFSEQGLRVMGATAGQTRWVLLPQNESNMENIRSFTMTSIEKGLDGLLLTLWDDDSPHFELYMRGILAFAEYSWSGDRRTKEEIKAAFRHREYSGTLSAGEYGFVDRLEKQVGIWNNILLRKGDRRDLAGLQDPGREAIIDLPDPHHKGAWSIRHEQKLELASTMLQECEEIAATLSAMKPQAIRNRYRLEIYEQVNDLVRFSALALLRLHSLDTAVSEPDEAEALGLVMELPKEFDTLRAELKRVYGETRILAKPEGYLLDQDHHRHLANQSISFDWQYASELAFLEKIRALAEE